MPSKHWYFKQLDIFSDLSPQELKQVSDCFFHRRFKKNQIVPDVHQSDTIYLVKEGIVELSSITQDGKKAIIDILTPGSFFGNLPKRVTAI